MRRWSRALTRLAGLVAGVSAAVLLGGCHSAEDPWKDVAAGQPRVLASFPPLYCFARKVAGPDAGVKCLLTTVGPHDFTPHAQDALKVRGADLFLVNGLGLDNFFATKVVNWSADRKVKVVAVGEAVPEQERLEVGEAEHGHDHGHEGHAHHHHGSTDPHVWLGIPEAVLMVERIRDELAARDPAHADGYQERAAAYIKELNQLQEEGKSLLASSKNRKIVSTHESLGYFARSFGLKLEGSIQPRPGVDADAAQLARLVKLCKDEGVRVITVEPQYSRATPETLGKQLQGKGQEVELVVVDPMETVPSDQLDPDYYVQKMRENVTNLARHLK